MRTANFRERIALAAMLAITILASFRNTDADSKERRPLPLLQGINSQASTMLISYSQRNTIDRLTRIQRASEDTYTDVRIPVYKNGRLASTLVSGHTNGENSEIFSSFEYTTNYPLIDKIHYYTQGQVQGYDSLVYNAAAQIIARYFFSRNADNTYECHNYQQYTWNGEGNIIRLDNYGRSRGGTNFEPGSSVTYTYDQHPNPQKQVTDLCYITDIMPAFLSANNILTEEIRYAGAAGTHLNTYSYEYNALKYPVSVTAHYGLDGLSDTTQLSYK
ncbi:hypothetical protein [uncultured Chitinophaga sp.]|jgi:hypothetical protein|uniref:hypothetical protein n=1 Tax=uncultured Chitinophaga sp. TaxID=339340 RepID=UPI00262FFEFC|nr:hypothetical protein [uncultured Chitinophaga sp.]